MKFTSAVRLAAAALSALGFAGAAQAHGDLNWSVGISVAPGVTMNVGHVPQVVMAPPVHVVQAPVYMAPQAPVRVVMLPPRVARPVYSSTVFMRPAPVIHSPVPRVAYVRHGHRHWHH